MRRILSVLIMLLLLTSCWDSAWRPVPLEPLIEVRLFRSSIQSANNYGNGYFILSVPAAPGNTSDETEGETVDEDTETTPSEPVNQTYAEVTIGLSNAEEPASFNIEAGLETVTIKNSSDEVILSKDVDEDDRATFRFDWTYGDELWNLKSGETEIITDLILEDGGNISIVAYPVLGTGGTDEDVDLDYYEFPDGIRLDRVYNHVTNTT